MTVTAVVADVDALGCDVLGCLLDRCGVEVVARTTSPFTAAVLARCLRPGVLVTGAGLGSLPADVGSARVVVVSGDETPGEFAVAVLSSAG